ncbi:hypothetical protein SERLA73DRAFT_162419 [Serpula lacrymans var. lacrymans S7.3]|uniref:Uncharacterized protein n=1 Tax=Serpula lacrymans var. lacrymans (strain S7.3) TaxID=936435 RepID=F8Q7S9_SERL3|nr:hypothetical protein SERLA73DRAFT_162419 [Serpula lacrymans var. lacrymans S7.3]
MSNTDTRDFNLDLVLHPLYDSDHPLGAHLRNLVKAGNFSSDPSARVDITPHGAGGLKATVTVGDPAHKQFQGFFATGTATSNVDVQSATGRLFYRGSPPADGDNKFWIQQFPGPTPKETGRLVLEFYTDERLTAVFKTDRGNGGTEGSGAWATIN